MCEKIKNLLINDTEVYSNDPGAANGTVIALQSYNYNYFTLEKNNLMKLK